MREQVMTLSGLSYAPPYRSGYEGHATLGLVPHRRKRPSSAMPMQRGRRRLSALGDAGPTMDPNGCRWEPEPTPTSIAPGRLPFDPGDYSKYGYDPRRAPFAPVTNPYWSFGQANLGVLTAAGAGGGEIYVTRAQTPPIMTAAAAQAAAAAREAEAARQRAADAEIAAREALRQLEELRRANQQAAADAAQVVAQATIDRANAAAELAAVKEERRREAIRIMEQAAMQAQAGAAAIPQDAFVAVDEEDTVVRSVEEVTQTVMQQRAPVPGWLLPVGVGAAVVAVGLLVLMK